ncbi:MAG: ABC transporter permease [Ruminococcaceae bacterium]|nr:ABC transporter permease [Oscillospiraceae bacterium]
MSSVNTPSHSLTVKKEFKLSSFLVKWEMILVYILVLINVILMIAKPNYYFAANTIPSIIQSGMDLSCMVLGMIFILLLGDIDVSVASIMVVCGMVMGLLKDAGMNDLIVVLCGLLAGVLCGLFNGVLVAKIGMPAVIVTIATSSLFRGIVKIRLDVNVLKNFPKWFQDLAWDNILGIPVALLIFLALAAVFAIVLHKGKFGRTLYMIGNNPVASLYSGINVTRTKILVFVIMGFMAGVSSIFFVGRMGGGLSSTMGKGYEMNVIAIAVLGGVSTSGGKGKVYGPVIATLIMAFLSYTMGLLGVDTNTRQIFTGIILIVAVLIPYFNKQLIDEIKLKLFYANNKNIEAVNIRCHEEVTEIRHKMKALKHDTSLSEADKAAKRKAYEDKIAALTKKCAQTTKAMKDELKQQNMKTNRALSK